MKSIIAWSTILFWILAINGVPEYMPGTPQAQVRIDRSKPTIYIGFEHTGERAPLYEGEGGQGIWLRLHNNTHWSIEVAAFEVPKALGDIGLYYSVQAEPGLEAGLSGLEPVGPKSVPRGYEIGDVFSKIPLEPGRSLLFSVPREHLARYLSIRVRFNYQWEAGARRSATEPEHYVVFAWDNLPRELRPAN